MKASDTNARQTSIRELVGSGDRIGLLTLPFLLIGIVLNFLYPPFFSVGGPPPILRAISWVALVVGLVIWAWSVMLILTKVPKRELIISGPFALMRHPLYTGVALFVVPWAGFLLDTWLGAVIGAVIYVGARLYAPDEERALAEDFGDAWDEYRASIRLPWL